jgi:hypothetical protein
MPLMSVLDDACADDASRAAFTVGSAYNRPLISHFGGKTTPFSIFCFYPILSPFCVPCLIVNQEINRHKNKNEI